MNLNRKSSKRESVTKPFNWKGRTVRDHWESGGWLLFGLLLVTVPVTSSPIIAYFTGESTVSPLAGVPLFLLFLFWFLPRVIRRGRLPRASAPLLLFFALALTTSLLTLFREIYPAFGQEVHTRTLRGVVSLGVGVGFYLIVATFPRSQDGLRRSLKWIHIGGLVMLIWASVQAYLIYSTGGIPHEFQNIHRIFSIYDAPRNRVAGLAYEPSWLGDQLVILYLPLWLSSVLSGYSVFSSKPRRLSVELALLLWGILIFILAESRISLLSVFAVIGVLVLRVGWQKSGQWAQRIRASRGDRPTGDRLTKGRLLHIIVWLALLVLLVVAIFAVLWMVSFIDWRIERIFQLDYLDILESSSTPFYTLSERLAYAERVVYWESGFRVFSRYSLMGVGVGNSGFSFQQNASAYGYHLPEIIRILTAEPRFPNTKSLWIRLLAETGLIGFLLFIAWLFRLAVGAWHLQRRHKGIVGVIGLAGSMTLIAQVVEGFSLDTFALAHLWVMLGLITTALSISSAEGEVVKKFEESQTFSDPMS